MGAPEYSEECDRLKLLFSRLKYPDKRSLRANSPFGDIVKSGRARGTREETRRWGLGKRVCRSLARSRAACFARANRRACSQAMTNSLTLLFQALLPRKFLINLFYRPRLFLIHLTLFVLFYNLKTSLQLTLFDVSFRI